MTAIIFLIVLAILIFVHELGHFIAARLCGIRVDAFALGFGPKLISWRFPTKHVITQGETEYSIRLIPFGGYVKIFGENPDYESVSGPDAHRSFVNKPRWQQVIVLAAGVIFNFIFAWILYAMAFGMGITALPDVFPQYVDRYHNERVMITYVDPKSPADIAGIKIGDVLVALDTVLGTSTPPHVHAAHVSIDPTHPDESITRVQKFIAQSSGSAVSVDVMRNEIEQRIVVQPKLNTQASNSPAQAYVIGIAMGDVVDFNMPVLSAISESGKYTLTFMRETIYGIFGLIGDIFKGKGSFDNVAGPVKIAGIVGDAAQFGFSSLLMTTALISVNLGIINLFPIPALDGGRILFVILEAIARRRIPAKFANIVNAVGFFLLMGLMVFITYREIAPLVLKFLGW